MSVLSFIKRGPAASKVNYNQRNRVPRSDAESVALGELTKRWDPDGVDAYHRAFQNEWWLNLAYYAGHQWVKWDAENTVLQRPEEPAWRVKYVANRILPMSQRAHAAMVADAAVLRAAPLTSDIRSQNAALLADQVYEWAINHGEYEERREEALLWAVVCGTGFVKITWNPNAGEEKTVLGSDGSQKVFRIGDFEFDSASPFQMRLPPYISLWRHMPWAVQVTQRSMEYIYEHWPKKASEVTPNEATDGVEYEVAARNIIGVLGGFGTYTAEGQANTVKVVELWTRPFVSQGPLGEKAYPKGLHLVVANQVVLSEGDNPYHELGFHLPYVPYHFGHMPGRFWGMSLVEQLREPQYQRNLARSQIAEHRNLMSFGKWVAPRGHGIPKTGFTSEPGEVLEYNPALPAPTMVVPPPLPAYVNESVIMTDQEMQDIAAQQDVTEAKAPSSVRSGVAISLLQAKDREVLAVPKKRLWRSDRMAGEMLLKIIQKQYDEIRTLQIVGQGRMFELKDFRGADLAGHTSLRIFAEGSMMDSRAARTQNILDFVQLGVIDPKVPEEKRALLSVLEIGDIRGYTSQMLADEKRARAENAAMAATTPVIPKVEWFDDHGVHLTTHMNLLKSPQYMTLDPMLQASISAHARQHLDLIMQAQAQAQTDEENKRGKPGEKGQASQPGSGTKGGTPGSDNGDTRDVRGGDSGAGGDKPSSDGGK